MHRTPAHAVRPEEADLCGQGELPKQIRGDASKCSVGGETPIVVRGVNPAHADAQRAFEKVPVGTRPV
jgi:hypothetical protein